ncbi:MAG: hypothetical protein WC654_02110 [Patescibacteria group bacterium]
MNGMIEGVNHVGLPSFFEDWSKIRLFWESLGLKCHDFEVTDERYDHGGAGPRLQVFAGIHLLFSYHGLRPTDGMSKIIMEDRIEVVCRMMHVALTMSPPGLESMRIHRAFERETHWGHSLTSVFLTGPYGLHIELVTTDPAYHRMSAK